MRVSIFRKLFTRNALTVIDDPVFGRITFESGLWSFIPQSEGDGHMVVIDAPETGPSPQQRDFYLKISRDLAGWENKARDYMQQRFPSNATVRTLATYAVIVGSEDETRSGTFTLELSDDEASEIHRVTFGGESPVSYEMDT